MIMRLLKACLRLSLLCVYIKEEAASCRLESAWPQTTSRGGPKPGRFQGDINPLLCIHMLNVCKWGVSHKTCVTITSVRNSIGNWEELSAVEHVKHDSVMTVGSAWARTHSCSASVLCLKVSKDSSSPILKMWTKPWLTFHTCYCSNDNTDSSRVSWLLKMENACFKKKLS